MNQRLTILRILSSHSRPFQATFAVFMASFLLYFLQLHAMITLLKHRIVKRAQGIAHSLVLHQSRTRNGLAIVKWATICLQVILPRLRHPHRVFDFNLLGRQGRLATLFLVERALIIQLRIKSIFLISDIRKELRFMIWLMWAALIRATFLGAQGGHLLTLNRHLILHNFNFAAPSHSKVLRFRGQHRLISTTLLGIQLAQISIGTGWRTASLMFSGL